VKDSKQFLCFPIQFSAVLHLSTDDTINEPWWLSLSGDGTHSWRGSDLAPPRWNHLDHIDHWHVMKQYWTYFTFPAI